MVGGKFWRDYCTRATEVPQVADASNATMVPACMARKFPEMMSEFAGRSFLKNSFCIIVSALAHKTEPDLLSNQI